MINSKVRDEIAAAIPTFSTQSIYLISTVLSTAEVSALRPDSKNILVIKKVKENSQLFLS